MEQTDLELEQRVWERVVGRQSMERVPNLEEMELRCRESAAVLHKLAQNSSGEIRERLTKLSKAERDNAMALLGIQILSGREVPPSRELPVGQISTNRALAQCCRRCQQACADYCACAKTGEFSEVFKAMAQEEAARTRDILSLIALVRKR